jgi:hypothetical protein
MIFPFRQAPPAIVIHDVARFSIWKDFSSKRSPRGEANVLPASILDIWRRCRQKSKKYSNYNRSNEARVRRRYLISPFAIGGAHDLRMGA